MSCKTNVSQECKASYGIINRYTSNSSSLKATIQSYLTAFEYQSKYDPVSIDFDHGFFNHSFNNFTDILPSAKSGDELNTLLSLVMDTFKLIKHKQMKQKILLCIESRKELAIAMDDHDSVDSCDIILQII